MSEEQYLQKRSQKVSDLLFTILEPSFFACTSEDLCKKLGFSSWELKALLQEFNLPPIQELISKIQVQKNQKNLFSQFEETQKLPLFPNINLKFKENESSEYLTFSYCFTRFGKCFAAFNDAESLVQLTFEDAEKGLNRLKKSYPNSDIRFDQHAGSEIEGFLNNTNDLTISISPKGSSFQLEVWKLLTQIEEGKVLNYENLAIALNDKNKSRAVGTAIGSNPIAVLIPCHRVLPKTGVVGNFRWRKERKQILLSLEN